MTPSEAKRFLSGSRSNLLLASVERSGDPNIHAVWYWFDPRSNRLYFVTGTASRKVRNMRANRTVYLSVDDDSFPLAMRGVRGKGRANIIRAGKRAQILAAKVLGRYLKPDHPVTQEYAAGVAKGESLVVEIAPKYFATWDYGKLPRDVWERQVSAALH